MREVIRQRDAIRVSSLYVTQNLDEVRYLCSHYYEIPPNAEPELRTEADDFCLTNTRIMLLNDGKIIFNSEDELFWDSQDERIRRFIL
jgi:hypothetical protein